MGEISAYLTGLGPLQVIGVAGFLIYIGAFASVQVGAMNGNGIVFSLCNVLAAALVGLSLLAEFNLASALIQSSFFIVGLIGVARWALRRRPFKQHHFKEAL